MVGHGGSSAGSYLADPTSPIPSHCASIVTTSTVRVKWWAHRLHDFLCLFAFAVGVVMLDKDSEETMSVVVAYTEDYHVPHTLQL